MTNDTARRLNSLLRLGASFATDASATSDLGRPFHETEARDLTPDEIATLRADLTIAQDYMNRALALLGGDEA